MSRTHVAVKEFRARVDAEFAYLTTDFGFRRERVRLTNQFSVSYVNATTRIYVEGINWGGAARVAFGNSGSLDTFENFDLLDFASIRCPDKAESATLAPQTQVSQLRALAALLRDCGEEVLRGDFTLAPRLRELRQRRVEASRRRDHDQRSGLDRR